MTTNNTHSVEHWLKRSAQGNLKDTVHGMDPKYLEVSQRVFDDPTLRLVYIIDLVSFIQGEKIALEAVANAMTFAPDDKSLIYLSTQALDEARHYESFNTRMDAIKVDNKSSIIEHFTTDKVIKLQDLVREQIDKKDFMGVVIALNVILEGLAFPTYRYERKFWEKLDPGMSDLVSRAYFDEAHHVGFGLNHVKSVTTDNHRLKASAQRLLHDFKILVVELLKEAKINQVKLYGEVIKNYTDLVGDVEIFPKRTIATTPVEEQMALLQDSIEKQFEKNIHYMRVG